MRSAGIIQNSTWYWTTHPATSQKRFGSTWNLQETTSPFEFLPPYTPQLNPIETAWRDLKRRLAGRHFRSTDELKRAITTIVECEMGNRLKGYLVA